MTPTAVIGDYPAAITIDGSTHYLLIQPGNASTSYRKINRNVFLGVSGQPADISSAQNITNKTLNNTNVLTIRDDRFTLQDSVDATKQATFELSGLTTATTRVMTLPDASTTLVGTGVTQTLTNKTLTAPVINNGSITGTTITTDAIVGQSSATSGTIYGISVTSGTIGASALASNSVTTPKILDGAVTPAKLFAGTGSSWVWQSYTPTLTSVTLGNGTLEGKYCQIGKTVFFYARITFGSTTSFTGGVRFSLPITSVNYITAYTKTLGSMTAFDVSAATASTGVALWQSTTTVEPNAQIVSTYTRGTAVNATQPMTWATGDVLDVQGFYEAA